MHTNSVETTDPPTQEGRTVIKSWYSEGYQLDLVDTGNRNADIIGTSRDGRKPYGQITFDATLDRHIIEWNRTGCLALEQYKRDAWDTKFYYKMAQWVRQREQASS
jgi:hypothetical protein